MPGRVMLAEMFEQPDALARLASRRASLVDGIRSRRRGRDVVFVARGSSDNAAVLGRYLVELTTGRPPALAAMSLHTRYDVRPDVAGQLVVALSQSGRTPEVVTTATRLRSAGAVVLAVVNEPDSPLAQAADLVVDLGAGPEIAVPATKTVTAQLAAMIVLAEGLSSSVPWTVDDWAQLPHDVAAALAIDPSPAVVERLAGAARLPVVARGLGYAAALEGALKLKETALLGAEAASIADLLHGPVAAVGAGTPVLVLDLAGPGHDDAQSLVSDLRARGAVPVVVGHGDGADVPVPGRTAEPFAVVTATVVLQRLAHAVSLARGLDPDAPAGLSKVTLTT